MAAVRPASINDVPVILEFIKALAEYEKLASDVVATVESLRATLFGDHPFAEVLLIEESGEALGFALFFHNYSTFLSKPGIYLEDLFIKPEARSRGLGKHLLSHIAKLAVERNCGRLEWSVLKWNTPAIDFYESLKAKPQSEWVVYRLDGKSLLEMAGRI